MRITVDLSETDRNPHQWLPWARRNLPPEFLAAMHPDGASLRQAKTWRLYSAPILPDEFVSVDLRWRDIQRRLAVRRVREARAGGSPRRRG